MHDIFEILLEKSKSNTLAHFYILRAPQGHPTPDTFLKEWVERFALSFIKIQKQCSDDVAKKTFEFDVPDLLILNKQEDRNKYVVEDLESLFKFVEMRPFEFKNKLVIVHQAHLIDKRTSNKLLKLLEEPTDNTTIFFLYGTHSKALSTIESRGINIQLKDKSYQQTSLKTFSNVQEYFASIESNKFTQNFLQFLQSKQTLAELLDFLYKKKEFEKDLIELTTELFHNFSKDYHSSSLFIDHIKQYEKEKTINMPYKTRIFPLLQLAKKTFSQ